MRASPSYEKIKNRSDGSNEQYNQDPEQLQASFLPVSDQIQNGDYDHNEVNDEQWCNNGNEIRGNCP
jgi:hypothetical protein